MSFPFSRTPFILQNSILDHVDQVLLGIELRKTNSYLRDLMTRRGLIPRSILQIDFLFEDLRIEDHQLLCKNLRIGIDINPGPSHEYLLIDGERIIFLDYIYQDQYQNDHSNPKHKGLPFTLQRDDPKYNHRKTHKRFDLHQPIQKTLFLLKNISQITQRLIFTKNPNKTKESEFFGHCYQGEMIEKPETYWINLFELIKNSWNIYGLNTAGMDYLETRFIHDHFQIISSRKLDILKDEMDLIGDEIFYYKTSQESESIKISCFHFQVYQKLLLFFVDERFLVDAIFWKGDLEMMEKELARLPGFLFPYDYFRYSSSPYGPHHSNNPYFFDMAWWNWLIRGPELFNAITYYGEIKVAHIIMTGVIDFYPDQENFYLCLHRVSYEHQLFKDKIKENQSKKSFLCFD